MDIEARILQVGLVVLTLFFIWITWKGLRTGAVNTLVKGSSVPVYAYRDKNPISYWSHIAAYIAVIIALPYLLLWLFVF